MNTLCATFCGVQFTNPLVLASGILGVTGGTMAEVVQNGAGGVTTKSWWVTRHEDLEKASDPFYLLIPIPG